MIQTYRAFSSPVVRVTSFQALDVTPPIKQTVMVPRGATSSTDIRTAVRLRLPVETDCLKSHAYYVFRLFLLYAVFGMRYCYAERRERIFFTLGICSVMGLYLRTSPSTKHSFQSKGIHMCAVFILQWKTSATFSILVFLH